MEKLALAFAFILFCSVSKAQYTVDSAPNDSIKFEVAKSLYMEYRKQQKNASALEFWLVAKSTQVEKSRTFYIRGRQIVIDLIEEAGSSRKRKKYIDLLFEIWEWREQEVGIDAKAKELMKKDKLLYLP